MDFTDLGIAEQHVAQEIQDEVHAMRRQAEELLKLLNEVNLNHIEELLMDVDSKEAMVKAIPAMQSVNKSLMRSTLVAIVLGVLTRDKEE